LQRVLEQIDPVASTDATVLILGETGTGKELIARAIHDRSSRRHRPLIKVNCGAVPRELFESEFFGHVKGAFTGALRDRAGRFHLAHEGTLFLEEVGEIPLELQPKLLRVLQDGEFERLGEDRTRRVDVRIVAATNHDLQHDVEAGRFREDLFYRLSVFPIRVPPLRERRDDIPLLTAHFLRQACSRLHCGPVTYTAEHIRQLQAYDWPGNVRELQNVIERAVIVSPGDALRLDLGLPSRVPGRRPLVPRRGPAPGSEPVSEAEWKRQERQNLLAALQQAGGKIYGPGGAAELLGVKPTTLASRLKALGIKKPSKRWKKPA
jgi:transcriptional regulator with GAF, ATPase, and Fis domain